jgi:hypothetical protein
MLTDRAGPSPTGRNGLCESVHASRWALSALGRTGVVRIAPRLGAVGHRASLVRLSCEGWEEARPGVISLDRGRSNFPPLPAEWFVVLCDTVQGLHDDAGEPPSPGASAIRDLYFKLLWPMALRCTQATPDAVIAPG